MAVSISKFQGLVDRTKNPILATIAALGIIYLAPKVISIHDTSIGNGIDFRYIWLAGKIWASGHNPYGPLFAKEDHDSFNLALGTLWVYPPYWYPIAFPFGLLSFQTANIIWKICNFLLLIAATHLIARALADVVRQSYLPIFLGGIGFACFMQSTAVTLFIGQTAILVYFGLAAMIFGILKERPLLIVTGLVFLALKPQIGIVAFPAVVALHRYRWTILPAGGLCLLATAPIAVSGDYSASIISFLSNLTGYSEISSNTPPNMTGLIDISNYLLTNSVTSSATPIVVLVAIIFAVMIFYNLSSNKETKFDGAQHLVASLSLFLASTFFFLPLHSYDLVALTTLLMMIMVIPFPGRYLIAFGLLICFRSRNLFDASGIVNSNDLSFPESHLASAGLFLIFIGALRSTLSYQMGTKTLARLIKCARPQD